MKNLFFKYFLVSGLVLGTVVTSCKKEEEVPEPDPTPPTMNNPCNGDPGFCMDYGSVNKSGPAKLFVYNGNKVRVYWENGSGNSFEQVELDIQGLSAGTYNVDDLAIQGSSAFLQYYSAANGTVNPAYGTVTVATLDTINGVTGTFTVTMKDSTKVTNGKFTSIVK